MMEYKLHTKTGFFQKKLKNASNLIIDVLNKTQKPYVSWSGGKDSTVVLALVLQQSPDITVLHIKSGYELLDGYQYMLQLVSLWNFNFIEINTPIDYLDLCQEFGLPHLRSKGTQVKTVSLIKKNPANEWAKRNDYDGFFWGLRAEESKSRRQFSQYKGKLFTDKNNILRISPILHWSIKDVWAFFEYFKIPINPIYLHENCGLTRETIRNTGWLSTDAERFGRLEWLRRNYPQQYQKVRELL